MLLLQFSGSVFFASRVSNRCRGGTALRPQVRKCICADGRWIQETFERAARGCLGGSFGGGILSVGGFSGGES